MDQPPSLAQKARHILIVARDEDVRKMLTKVVQVEYSCTITAVRSSQDMQAAVRRQRPDLVIVYAGPESGAAIALSTSLRATPGLEQIPIILTDVIALPVPPPADPFLVILGSPFVLKRLYAAIAGSLDLRRQVPEEEESAN